MRTFYCLGAMDEKRGIGKNGGVPWNLPKQYNTYFEKRSKEVTNDNKQNALIMGRLTYFSFPQNIRPLKNRLNIVLSNSLTSSDLPSNVMLFKNLDSAMKTLSSEPLCDSIEDVFICGGQDMYKEAVASPLCKRIYLTQISATFDCDVFFPEFDKEIYKEIHLPDVCVGEEEENGIRYRLHIYSSEK